MTLLKHIIHLGFLLIPIFLIPKTTAGPVDPPSDHSNGKVTINTSKLLSEIGEPENKYNGPLLRRSIASSAQPDFITATNIKRHSKKTDIKPQLTVLIIGYSALTIAWWHSGKHELYRRKN